MTVRVACVCQYESTKDCHQLNRDVYTYGSGLGACKQEVEAFTREAVHRLLRLGHSLRLHQVRENSAILGVVKSSLDIFRNYNIHLVHDRLDIFTHVVGHKRQDLSHLTAQGIMSHHVSAAEERLDPSGKVWLPAFLSKEAHRLTEGVLRDHIGSEAIECLFDIEGLLSSRSEHLVDGHLSKVVHFSLKLEHLRTREELRQCALAHSVDFMVDGRESSDSDRPSTTSVQLMLPFVANASGSSVDLVGKVRIRAVEFVWVDPDDGAWNTIRI
jgi:hypothetical protein